MPTNKTQKCSSSSSSSSLSKFFSRITRTLSFTSKKSQQTFKNNTKKVQPTETVIKNMNFVPQSAPLIRRQLPHSIAKIIYTDNCEKENCYRNIHVEVNIEEEEDDDDYHVRYSLRPNLSLFNISAENLNYQSQGFIPSQQDWLDDIFHSTKIEEN
ncbi:unnamed protein product [Adineta steineri]|uniref:Uncharacterized protein n=1 Tax=Adineta steineri TaxID=433720 RepID=A0A819MSA3_9BILA|nr:unnamed protein product [Adineta steineri]